MYAQNASEILNFRLYCQISKTLGNGENLAKAENVAHKHTCGVTKRNQLRFLISQQMVSNSVKVLRDQLDLNTKKLRPLLRKESVLLPYLRRSKDMKVSVLVWMDRQEKFTIHPARLHAML